jgi:DNA-binding response OmpR family regulator
MKTYTILIADDYPENLQIIAEALQCSDIKHKIIKAINGRVLCDLAEKRIPDLIITDWEMPIMNGIEAIKYLKNLEATKNIPIIMCTGIMTTSQNLKTALESGAVDFIKKPVDAIELQSRVYSMLRLSDSYKTIREQNLTLENQKEKILAQKNEIERQHSLIQKKNLHISSSIQYAQNIQKAILPPKCTIDSLGENFIVYKPKDIVSGDFYWYADLSESLIQPEEKDSVSNFKQIHIAYKFLAVVDCTGHGVPGAFMSMIANTLLNEIVFSMKIYSPQIILKILQKKIKKTLHQIDSDNDEGMDIGICRFEKDNYTTRLTFSGAKHSLFYYCPPTKKLQVIKGSRASIGGFLYDQNENFQEETISLKQNDLIYMFTDGTICHIKENGRKLGTSNFLSMITQNIDLPLDIQKEKIEALFSSNKQLDDITVIGVKIC